MKGTTLALLFSLALMAIAIVVTLSGSPVAVLGANSTFANGYLAETTASAQACQGGETLPAGTSMIRLTLTAEVGPPTRVYATSGGRPLTSGSVGSGWTGGSVSIPVKRVAARVSGARVCFALDASKETVGIVGSPTAANVAARDRNGAILPGRIKVEYLSAAHSSWWSNTLNVARRIGLGHAPSGTWVVFLTIALMGALVAAASWLLLREFR